MTLFCLLCRLTWARLRRDEFAALSIMKEIIVLTFENMDAAITSVSAKVAADKAALDDANAKLAAAQADVANAQGQLDQRTAAITAAIA
jgi:hypothetical protein